MDDLVRNQYPTLSDEEIEKSDSKENESQFSVLAGGTRRGTIFVVKQGDSWVIAGLDVCNSLLTGTKETPP